MPVSFRILPRHGLVYVRYDGFARVDDTLAIFGEYARHPDCRPGQKQLVDLSRVTGYEKNYARAFEMQARKADVFMASDAQMMLVYFAPGRIPLEMARLVVRSWEHVPGIVPLVQQVEADALALLGLAETSFDELLVTAN